VSWGYGYVGFVPGAGTDLHVYRLLKTFGVKQDLSVGRKETDG